MCCYDGGSDGNLVALLGTFRHGDSGSSPGFSPPFATVTPGVPRQPFGLEVLVYCGNKRNICTIYKISRVERRKQGSNLEKIKVVSGFGRTYRTAYRTVPSTAAAVASRLHLAP